MKMYLTQNEIEDAVKYYVKNYYGMSLEVSKVELAATRGNDGITANIELCPQQLGTDNCNCCSNTLSSRREESDDSINREPEEFTQQPEVVSELPVSDTVSGNEDNGNNEGNDKESTEEPMGGHSTSSSSRSLFANLTK